MRCWRQRLLKRMLWLFLVVVVCDCDCSCRFPERIYEVVLEAAFHYCNHREAVVAEEHESMD